MKFLWQDTLVVTDPTALAGVCAVCVCMCFDRPHVNGLSSVPLQLIQDPCLCSNSNGNDTSCISNRTCSSTSSSSSSSSSSCSIQRLRG